MNHRSAGCPVGCRAVTLHPPPELSTRSWVALLQVVAPQNPLPRHRWPGRSARFFPGLFLLRSRPWLLTTAAEGGLELAPAAGSEGRPSSIKQLPTLGPPRTGACKLLSKGLIGAPCGVPRPSSRLRVLRCFLPCSSVSSTGASSHILIRCSIAPLTTRRASDFISSACGIES